ncbi:MAG TPA: GntR family transcriptional regulator [Anaerolineae bacterium]|nr:GntR family transcriptional regulator [Anaerolineae bacterium]HIQ04714.1 GntR family transcriptional regulator [Anaerolineae bacterium]
MSSGLDRSHPLPLYAQLQEQLRNWIEQGLQDGTLAPDRVIPSEHELCQQYDVSRITVKRALDELVREGLLYRRQGKGTFIAGQKIEHDLRLLGFSAMMRHLGIEPSSRVLEATVVSAAPYIAHKLRLEEGAPLIRLARLRLGNGEPLSISTSHLPQHLFPDMLNENLTGSLFELLDKRYHMRPERIWEAIDPVQLKGADAECLEVPEGTLALRSETIVYTHGDLPIEHNVSLMRSDRARYVLEHHR